MKSTGRVMSVVIPSTQPPSVVSASIKRKHSSEAPAKDVALKGNVYPAMAQFPIRCPSSPTEPVLVRLRSKYEVKPMSVLPSTSIRKHIDSSRASRPLQFLDERVLPGVVLLHAKSKAASKAITIAETMRRRINEAAQKWYQYNILER